MNNTNMLEAILIKYLSGSASESERNKARTWINSSAENIKHFQELKEYYQLTKIVQIPSGFDKAEGWERIRSGYYRKKLTLEEEREKIRRRKIMQWMSAIFTAAVFCAFFLGAYFNKHWDKSGPEKLYNEIVVPLGSKAQISLPDGSNVWLNAGSKMKYPVSFYNNRRNVYLEGEAFFDVASDKKRIFIVKTGEINVKVYGTQFNIKSYPNENQIQTTLVNGSVAIESVSESGKNKIIYLRPNQTAIYYRSSKTIDAVDAHPSAVNNQADIPEKIEVVPKSNLLPIISWKDSKWVITGTELGKLAVELERRYNVVITFESENLKSYKFSGTLMDETFEQVLRIMQLSAPLLFTIEGNKVVFKEDPLYKKNYDKMITNSN